MRNTLFLIAALAAVALAAACQSQQNANTATATNSNANIVGSAQHDMSNMANHDMSSMANHDMSKMPGMNSNMQMTSAPGAAEQPFDLQFIDSMIHHHEGAIQMANMVIGKTQRPELKQFAQKMIDDQSKEIDHMEQWREQWYAGKPSALNMEMPGMVGGTKIMNSEHMKEMDSMPPNHFDDHFLNMMTAHHEGAVTMAKDALKRAEHPEIKTLSEQIIKTQQAEIDQMKAWKKKWENDKE